MSFVKTDGGTTVVQYPYTRADLKADNPNTSFRSDISSHDLSDFNVFPVQPTAQPAPSNADNVVVEGDPTFVDPDWVQTWVEQAASASELLAAQTAKATLCRAQFVAKVDAAALAAGFSQENLDLIESTSAFSASVLSFIFANGSQAFRDNVNLCRTNLQSKLAAIDAATTLSQVDAVDENTGWPV